MRQLLIALSTCLLLAVPAVAVQSHTGTITQIDDTQVVVETDSGEQTLEWTGDLTRPDDLEKGDAVIVRFDADQPSEVLLIDEQVQVADSDLERYHAIAGTLQEVNPDHMILETQTGQEAFVIYPEKLFPPMPAEGKRVAVIYRETGTTSKYSQFAASEIIELDESFQLANNVEVSYSDIEQPEPQETQVAEASEPEMTEPEMTETQTYEPSDDEMTETETAETERTLPQTASALPLIGLIGLLAALGWIALGVLRR